MESGQPTKTARESAKPKATSDDLAKSRLVADTAKRVLGTSYSSATPATTLTVSRKTLTSVELEALKSKAGLVAAATADYMAQDGMALIKTVEFRLASGTRRAVKIVLYDTRFDLVAEETADGKVINLVALKDEAK